MCSVNVTGVCVPRTWAGGYNLEEDQVIWKEKGYDSILYHIH